MDAITNGLVGDKVFQYFVVATTCLVSYEYLIMLDTEIRNLWGCRFTFGGALLLLCRYLPLTSVLQAYFYISASDLDISSCITGFRVSYAVWGGSKKVFCLLVVTFVVVLAGSSYLLYCNLLGVSMLAIRDLNGCLPLTVNDDVWILLAGFVFLESLALDLLLLKYTQHATALKYFCRHESKRNIMLVMVQDGVGYFACTLAITTLNLVLLKRLTPELRDILLSAQGAVQNILCSRLLFHLRSVDDSPNVTYESGTYESRISSGASTPMFVNVTRTTEYC